MLLTAPADEAHMKGRQMRGFREPEWKEPAKSGQIRSFRRLIFLGGMPRAPESSEFPHLARHRLVRTNFGPSN